MSTNYTYKNLAAEMARNGVTADDIAGVLHCSRNNVYQKLRGNVQFNLKDMHEIQGFMNSKAGAGGFSLDYLFNEDSGKD